MVEDLGASEGKTEHVPLKIEFKHTLDLDFERLTTSHMRPLRKDG
jgi:hypothetical protein